MRFLFKIFLLMSFSSPVMAAQLGFENLDQSDVDDVFKEFAATFTHATVSGASSKLRPFAFEFGLVAGATRLNKVKDLVAEALPSSSEELEFLPFVSLYGSVSLPLGLSVEANFIPQLEIEDIEFSHLSLAAKMELTSLIPGNSVNISAKAYLINSNLKYSQATTSYSGEVKFVQNQFGLEAKLSKKFLFVEPYVFLGFVSANGDVEGKGTGSIFGGTITGQSKVESRVTSEQIGFGLEVNLFLAKTGIEYINSFETGHLNVKLALSF